ncbi:MFS general substrate transporter [Stipitochalara longipes BDJ]|nr:MFS general substrate transporter [Stipitochalara longipes BDJ]
MTAMSVSAQRVLVVTTATLVIATVFTTARLVSRLVIVRKITWDDYFIVFGWVLAFGLSFSVCYGTSKGLGLRDANIPEDWKYPLRKCEYAFAVLYNPSLMATKSSILILYLRLSRNAHKLLRVASWVTLAVVNIAGLVLTFFNVFQCLPVSQVFAPVGTCIPLITLYLASVPVNVITDIAILILPIPVLTSMQLPRKQKMILIATFGLGIYVIATDVVRIYYLQQSSGPSNPTTSPLLGNEVDFSYHASISFMWSAVEVNLGIVCACIPTMKPLISRILPILIDNRRSTSCSSCFGSLYKSSNQGTTAISSPTPGNATGVASPISFPQPALISANDSLLVSRDRFSSNATEWTMTGDGGHEPDHHIQEARRPLPNVGLGLQDPVASPIADSDRGNRASTVQGRTEAEVFFGFIHLRAPRSMLRASTRDSIKYCTLISILFFIVGFSRGLWNNLNNQVSKITSDSEARTMGLYTAYFGAYALGPVTVGRYCLTKSTFKATFITGLCIYGTGVFIYWPSEVLLSYPGFLVANFFVGFGVSVIETAANPFFVLCGHSYYSEIRLLLGQTVEAVGKVVGMVVAEKGLWHDISDGPSLLSIQWLYLAVALLNVVLALALYYLPLPEVTDDDLQLQTQPGLPQLNQIFTALAQSERRFRYINCRVIFVTLSLAFFAQFLYCGVHESNSLFLNQTLDTPGLSTSSFNYGIIANASTIGGRVVFAATCIFLPPRIVLLISFIGALIFSILVLSITNVDPNTTAGLIIALFFFQSPMWPMILATGLRRMGRRTKMAAVILTSAECGAGFLPWLFFIIINHDKRTGQYAYCLSVALLGLGTLYPIYLSVFSKAREQVDRGEKPMPQNRSRSSGSNRSPGDMGTPRYPGTPPAIVVNGVSPAVLSQRRTSRRFSSLSTIMKHAMKRRNPSVADQGIEFDTGVVTERRVNGR